jgi:hypothetical protein
VCVCVCARCVDRFFTSFNCSMLHVLVMINLNKSNKAFISSLAALKSNNYIVQQHVTFITIYIIDSSTASIILITTIIKVVQTHRIRLFNNHNAYNIIHCCARQKN